MSRVVFTEQPSVDVRRYLRFWTDQAFVAQRLREQHPSMRHDARRTKAKQVTRLVHQGLEFLESADGSSVLTKPLTLFYGTENLAKAACLVRDDQLSPDEVRFHGLGGERETKRYSVKNLSCKVHAPRKDVWSHFFRLFNSDRYRFSITRDGASGLTELRHQHPTAALRANDSIRLGTLLRHLPEMVYDLRAVGWDQPTVVPATTFRVTATTGPPPTHSLRFTLRHDHHARTKDMIIACESNLLRRFDRARDVMDVVEYTLKKEQEAQAPDIRLDVFGQIYMDLYRGRRVLGEPTIYLASLFILSDFARYQPEHWLRLLEDHPGEAIAVDRFLDVAVRKVPNLVLSELEDELFLFRSSD